MSSILETDSVVGELTTPEAEAEILCRARLSNCQRIRNERGHAFCDLVGNDLKEGDIVIYVKHTRSRIDRYVAIFDGFSKTGLSANIRYSMWASGRLEKSSVSCENIVKVPNDQTNI